MHVIAMQQQKRKCELKDRNDQGQATKQFMIVIAQQQESESARHGQKCEDGQ
jgi:hypothetical protein